MNKRLLMFIFALMILALPVSVYGYDYDVTNPHVIINQILGGSGGYVSHNFIELYNPTENSVELTGWALHYRSSPADTKNNSDKWYKLDLSGTIPAHHSYLIRCGNVAEVAAERTITSYDIEFELAGGYSLDI